MDPAPRRRLLSGLLAAAPLLVPAAVLRAQTAATEPRLRIGYQKFGTFTLVKARGTLERRLAALGLQATWTEFPAGPQLLEGLNVGSIDLGTVGEAPPIFAQAAGAPIAYVGYEPPAPEGEVILVPHGSPIARVAELRGKRIALNRGSNVHYFLVRALQEAGVSIREVQTAFLPPADARAAFERGGVDAWVIWDPFAAVAENAIGARRLRDGTGLVQNHQFYIASRSALAANPRGIAAMVEELRELPAWLAASTDQAVEILAGETRMDAPSLRLTLQRARFGVRRIDDAVIAEQQRMADTFFELGIVPRRIAVAEAAPAAARVF
jgi:sulfonate transport system substrate-binding protein